MQTWRRCLIRVVLAQIQLNLSKALTPQEVWMGAEKQREGNYALLLFIKKLLI